MQNALMLTQPRLHMVAYDLRRPHQDYNALHSALDEANALRIQQSTYWLCTTLTAVQVRDAMLTLIDKNDSVTVVEMSGDVAGFESRADIRARIERYLRLRTH